MSSLNNYSVIIRQHYDEEVFIKAHTEEGALELASRMYTDYKVLRAQLNNNWWCKHHKGVC